jgi:hypothetical protein
LKTPLILQQDTVMEVETKRILKSMKYSSQTALVKNFQQRTVSNSHIQLDGDSFQTTQDATKALPSKCSDQSVVFNVLPSNAY